MRAEVTLLAEILAEVCRTAKSSSHSWPFSGLRWVTGKEPLLGLNLFSVSKGGHGCSSSAEKDADEMNQRTDDYSMGSFSVFEGGGHRPKHQWRENGHVRKLQRYRTQRLMTHFHRNTAHDPECHGRCEGLTERPCLHKSLTSLVPLRIKVNGQRGGLGICIAGGKGSLPYKENDEGIFISRVSKEGPAEKAGVHVGDRVLELTCPHSPADYSLT
ncbi:uncharacterized protein LOC130559246 [Triplophysa rosa]|uniref:uncharacterized protein LOC130559246 n=1 Tax=Triplophysa rosa TaxID=992332 RepID=UPI0025460B4B|nr:uncharacterized protein LOC130559246 [Triplophysa rosa]